MSCLARRGLGVRDPAGRVQRRNSVCTVSGRKRRLSSRLDPPGVQIPRGCLSRIDGPAALSLFSVPAAARTQQTRNLGPLQTCKFTSHCRRMRHGPAANTAAGPSTFLVASPVFHHATADAAAALPKFFCFSSNYGAYRRAPSVRASRVPEPTASQRFPFEGVSDTSHSGDLPSTCQVASPPPIAPGVPPGISALPSRSPSLHGASFPALRLSRRNIRSWSHEWTSLHHTPHLMSSASPVPSARLDTSSPYSPPSILSSLSSSSTPRHSVALDPLFSFLQTRFTRLLVRQFLPSGVLVGSPTPEHFELYCPVVFFFLRCRNPGWLVLRSAPARPPFDFLDSGLWCSKTSTLIQEAKGVFKTLRDRVGSLIERTVVNGAPADRGLPAFEDDQPASSPLYLDSLDRRGLRPVPGSTPHCFKHQGCVILRGGRDGGGDSSGVDGRRLKESLGTERLRGPVGAFSIEAVRKWMEDLWIQLWKGNQWKGGFSVPE